MLMPDVSWLTKRSFRKLPRDYHLRSAEKTESSLAAAWQLLVSDSSKRAGPTPGAGGHSVASQEWERGTWEWDMGEATQYLLDLD